MDHQPKPQKPESRNQAEHQKKWQEKWFMQQVGSYTTPIRVKYWAAQKMIDVDQHRANHNHICFSPLTAKKHTSYDSWDQEVKRQMQRKS